MDIFIDPDSQLGLVDQIYEGLRSAIVERRVGSGERLPASRELAETLGVSRFTVTTAYGRLSAEGFLEGRRGGGTLVSDLSHLDSPSGARSGPSSAIGKRPAGSHPLRFDLRPGTPDQKLFPATEWKRYLRWGVDQHLAVYDEPAGVADLRLALAHWIGRSRGVDAGFRELIVTSGAQQAFYLLANVAASPGDVVAMEDPGYHRFRKMAEASGLVVANVPVDEEGIVAEAITPGTKVVYVTPSHQFPSGVTMSMRRRVELLELAADQGMVIIEDDYDSEFRYVDRPLEPLYRLDQVGLVAYVGSFSKVLSPALRLGFAVIPPLLLEAVLELRRQVDGAPSQVDQLALRGFIVDGHLDRHLRRASRVYGTRHRHVTEALGRLADRGAVRAPVSNAGLHVSVELPNEMDQTELVIRLAQKGVAVDNYATYTASEWSRPGLVIGFGQVGEADLAEALATIESIISG